MCNKPFLVAIIGLLAGCTSWPSIDIEGEWPEPVFLIERTLNVTEINVDKVVIRNSKLQRITHWYAVEDGSNKDRLYQEIKFGSKLNGFHIDILEKLVYGYYEVTIVDYPRTNAEVDFIVLDNSNEKEVVKVKPDFKYDYIKCLYEYKFNKAKIQLACKDYMAKSEEVIN